MTRIDEQLDELKLVTDKAARLLNNRQLIDYQEERKRFFRWKLSIGKNLEYGEGYALEAV